jgi:hypothetical protein
MWDHQTLGLLIITRKSVDEHRMNPFTTQLRLACDNPILVTDYCYEVVTYKAAYALRPFSDLFCAPI